MSNQHTDRNPVEVLADEFAARFRRGERPSVAEYTERYPDHADEIQDLFPSIVMMEQLKEKQESDQSALAGRRHFGGKRLERLGDYEIVQEIGRGGMGVVFEATQASLGRRVALKLLSDSATASEKHVQRFEREARAAAALHHTNIVPVFGVGHEDELHFYVMQYIEGVGLDEVLAALRQVAAEKAASADSGSAAVLAQALRCGSFAGPRKIGSSSSLTLARETLDATAGDETIRPQTLSDSVVHEEPAPADITGSLAGKPPIPASDPSSDPPQVNEKSSGPLGGSFGSQYFKSVARIGLQVADALQYAHGQNVLHRDIKPGNLLLDAQGTVWVTDFGLAKLTKQQDLTKTGDIVGTLRYMAPEQIDGKADQRSDIYSLGLTIYELLTLQPACDDKAIKQLLEKRHSDPTPRPRTINREIPADLETIVLKAISPEPNHRYGTAAELAEDFQRFLDDRPILARRASTVERLWRWSRRNPAMAALSGTALALAMLVVLLLSVGLIRSDQARIAAEEANEQARTNLDVAVQLFDKIIKNIGSRGAPLLFAAEPDEDSAGGEQDLRYETVVTSADAELLADLLEIFERFAQQNVADLGEKNASAYRHIGDIQQRLKRRDEAVEAYSHALQRYERLAAAEPEDARFVVQQAEILNEIANTEVLLGSRRRAREVSQRARRLLLQQPETLARDPRIRFTLAQTYLQMMPRISSDILDYIDRERPGSRERLIRMTSERARNAYPEAERLLVGLHDDYRENRDYRLALARCYLGQIRLAALNGDQIDPLCEKPVAILRQLVEEDSSDPRYQYELADALTLVCGLEQYGGDRLAQIGDAVSLSRSLVARLPSQPEYEELLSRCLIEEGKVLDRTQQTDEAAAVYAEVVKLRGTLIDRYPSVTAYQIQLVVALRQYADVLATLQRIEEELNVRLEADYWYGKLPQRRGRGRPPQNPRERR